MKKSVGRSAAFIACDIVFQNDSLGNDGWTRRSYCEALAIIATRTQQIQCIGSQNGASNSGGQLTVYALYMDHGCEHFISQFAL